MRVTESMRPAWETMKRILFRPFHAGTWFSFGFVFFLQSCMEGGGGGGNGLNLPGNNSGGSHGHDGDTGNNLLGVMHDVSSAFGLSRGAGELPETGVIIIILAAACIIAIPLVILMMWLGTRGQMMAIRAVAGGQAGIGEQWNATRDAGGMLFKWNLAMSGISLVLFAPLIVIGVLTALPVMRDGATIESVLPILLGIGAVAILFMLPFYVMGAMARNFVAPLMLKHGIGARDGWKRFWAVGRNHVGSIFVFYIMRVLVSISAGIVGVVASVMTCCLGFLPVLHQTLMAPYYVFERAWVLEVLASMSPDFDLRTSGPTPPSPYGQGTGFGPNPYGGPAPGDNPYAPPGYGGGNPYGGTGGNQPPGGFGSP